VKKNKWIASVIATLLSTTASASLITIDPDNFSPGEIIAVPENGVYVYDRKTWEPIRAVNSGPSAITGDFTFGNFISMGNRLEPDDRLHRRENLFLTFPEDSFNTWDSGLVFNIQGGTNYASIWANSYSGIGDAYFNAYDKNGYLITSIAPRQTDGYCGELSTEYQCVFKMEINSANDEIFWLMAGGTQSGRTLDVFSYRAKATVSEPSTFGLISVGLTAIAFVRRKKKQ